MDINRENYEIGLPIIEKAGLAHKIDFREGPALPALDQMIEDVRFIKISLSLSLSLKFLEQCYGNNCPDTNLDVFGAVWYTWSLQNICGAHTIHVNLHLDRL